MNKLISLVAVLYVFFFTSFIEKISVPGKGLAEGYLAPAITLEDFGPEQVKGKKLLVSFWAAYDASSRVSNALLASQAGKLPNDIQFVSIGFDADTTVFNETVKLDKLQESTHCYVRNGSSSGLYKTYKLKEGFGNYLINEEGVIIAKNLDPESLKKLIFPIK